MLPDQKVNLFIVGAAKSGTTTVFKQLAAHPCICMSSVKEPNYFSSSELLQDALYYREKIITSLESYEKLFNPKHNQSVIGESSVSYLFYPGTAEKIFSYNPDAKIIILLRDPVQRAFSHYLMDKKLGLITDTFEEIIRGEKNNELHSKYFQQYVNYGLYSKQVAAYYNVFPSNQVMVILFDDLLQSTQGVFKRLTGFLNLTDELFSFTEERYNEASTPDGPILNFLYHMGPLRKFIKMLIPEIIEKKIKSRFFISMDEKLTESQEFWLKKYFKADILELEKIINRKLSAWHEN